MAETRVVETVHGTVEYEVTPCIMCAQEVKVEETLPLTIEDGDSPVTGDVCELCFESNFEWEGDVPESVHIENTTEGGKKEYISEMISIVIGILIGVVLLDPGTFMMMLKIAIGLAILAAVVIAILIMLWEETKDF